MTDADKQRLAELARAYLKADAEYEKAQVDFNEAETRVSETCEAGEMAEESLLSEMRRLKVDAMTVGGRFFRRAGENSLICYGDDNGILSLD